MKLISKLSAGVATGLVALALAWAGLALAGQLPTPAAFAAGNSDGAACAGACDGAACTQPESCCADAEEVVKELQHV